MRPARCCRACMAARSSRRASRTSPTRRAASSPPTRSARSASAAAALIPNNCVAVHQHRHHHRGGGARAHATRGPAGHHQQPPCRRRCSIRHPRDRGDRRRRHRCGAPTAASSATAAVDLIRQFKVDYAVIGASAIDDDGALLDFDYREVRVAQAIIENARNVILVADAMKFDALARRCGSAISARSTSSSPTRTCRADLREHLPARGVQVIEAAAAAASSTMRPIRSLTARDFRSLSDGFARRSCARDHIRFRAFEISLRER